MPYSLGIIGLPNAGKSTLFAALSKQSVAIAPYPFTTVDPNRAVVAVPDERLEKLGEALTISKRTPAAIEVIDIAGLVKGAYKGEGLGNQFLAQIRETDAIVYVVRNFKNQKVPGAINPQEDYDVLTAELLMKDLETADKEVERFSAAAAAGETKMKEALAFWKDMREALARGVSAREHPFDRKEEFLKEVPLLSAKPSLVVCNGDPTASCLLPNALSLDAAAELEARSLSQEEQKELGFVSRLPVLLAETKKLLGLLAFFTAAGEREARAWLMPHGSTAQEAAGLVHTDFAEKLVRVEAISWEDLVRAKGFVQARARGLVRTEGREYAVQEGDVLTFKI